MGPMTDAEKLAALSALLTTADGAPDEVALSAVLEVAGMRVVERAYPFVADRSRIPVPERYGYVQVRLAQDMWNRRGAEGESSHNENGVSRSYEDSDKILSAVVPLGRVAGPARDISSAAVSVAEVASFDGTPAEPGVTVTLDGTELRRGLDYVVSYAGNDAPGTATATAFGIVGFSGSASAEFEVPEPEVPKPEVPEPEVPEP